MPTGREWTHESRTCTLPSRPARPGLRARILPLAHLISELGRHLWGSLMSNTPRRRVLVTGATGFVGRTIISAMTERDDLVVIAACRRPEALPHGFAGEVRAGDLRDAEYRKRVVQEVDVVCHAGTWSSLWGHRRQERTNFLEPALDLVEQSIRAGVGRFVLTGTLVTSSPPGEAPLDDFAPSQTTGFWPHLDALIALDAFMRHNRDRGTQMVHLRLGHFVGAGNTLGLVPALVPRLRTRLVPWINHGRHRLALVAEDDIAQAFVLATTADALDSYEAFNIAGPECPTSREVFELIAEETGFPLPWFSVPGGLAAGFGWLMEACHLLFPFIPGRSPFLTRSIVHLAEDWPVSTSYAQTKLGFRPSTDWRAASRAALRELRAAHYPWPRLAQSTG